MKIHRTGLSMQANEGFRVKQLPDYKVYRLSFREKLAYSAIGLGAVFAAGMLFFQHPIIALLMMPIGLLYPRYRALSLAKQRRNELSRQFRDALYALSAALGAGRSLETAFYTATRDLKILYPEPNTMILREFEYICRRLEMNESLERTLQDFGRRSGLEDIRNFADVITVCKQVGGNLVEVSRRSSEIIGEKIEIEQEIDVLLARPRLEQRMLMGMPVIFLCLLNAGGTGYTRSLFSSWTGYLVMLLSLGLLAGAAWLSQRIMDIEV